MNFLEFHWRSDKVIIFREVSMNSGVIHTTLS